MDREVEKGPSRPCQILSQAVADNRIRKFAFEKHSCNLPGNVRDKSKMIKVICLKSECKCKMGGREPLELFPGRYDISSAP